MKELGSKSNYKSFATCWDAQRMHAWAEACSMYVAEVSSSWQNKPMKSFGSKLYLHNDICSQAGESRCIIF